MELKKNPNADIESIRTPLIASGLLLIGGLVLAAFTYTTEIKSEDKLASGDDTTEIQYIEEEVDEPEQIETPPPPTVDAPPPITEEIEVEENTEKEPDVVVVTDPPVETAPVEEVVIEEEIIDFPDVEAQFPGGVVAMKKWIAENIQYPQTAIEMNEQGRVFLSFVVEPDGRITNIKVERGVSPDLDREAKRVVRKMPKWVAGESGGKKVRTRCRLPINFTLQ